MMARVINYNPFAVNVSFSKAELDRIEQEAARRQRPKDQNIQSVTDKRIVNRKNEITHMIGLLGEVAVGRLINTSPDMDVYLGGDTVKDFTVYGVGIEVKTLQGYLTFKKLSDFVTDIAVLVIYNQNDYSSVTVQGWITRQDFDKSHFVDNFGYGDRPCVQPSDLHPISTLKTHCLTVRNMRWMTERFLPAVGGGQ